MKKILRFMPFSGLIKTSFKSNADSFRAMRNNSQIIFNSVNNLRNSAPKKKVKIRNFEDFKLWWGLCNSGQIKARMRLLKQEIAIYGSVALLMISAAWYTLPPTWVILQLAGVTMAMIFIAATKAWFWDILRSQEYRPFHYWIIGRKFE